jgi:glycosyltransferase involved in cell wall biosynthesis
MPKKVLHLVSSYTTSGVISNLKMIARKLAQRDWQPHVYHYSQRNGSLSHFFDDGLLIQRIPKPPHWLKGLSARWIVCYLKRLLRKIRPDLIHAHSFDADLLALRAANDLQIPVVITCQSFSYLDWAKQHLDHYHRWKKQTGAVVSVTRAMATEIQSLAAFTDLPHEVIYNTPAERFFVPCDAAAQAAWRKQFGIENRDVLIVCTATFHPIKGHIVLADAFAALASHGPHAKLILIGDTLGQPEYCRILQQVEESLAGSQCRNRFQIIQGCRDALPVLRAADIYVQPSFMEALSVATAEAMAMGLPAVVSNVGGLKEMVVEGVAGFQVEPGNCQQLASALQRLIDDHSLRRRMGNAARRHAESNFSPDVAVEKYAAVYERAVGR